MATIDKKNSHLFLKKPESSKILEEDKQKTKANTIFIIKKVPQNTGRYQSGGAWKVAYADFITSLMALFMLMWLLNSVPSIKLQEIAEYFKSGRSVFDHDNDNRVVNEKTTTDKQKYDDFISEERDLNNLLTQIGLESYDAISMVQTVDGVMLTISDREAKPMFTPGDDVPTQYLQDILTKLSVFLKNSNYFISISGYTSKDTERQLENRGKWEIAAARANSARRFLIQNGMSPELVIEVASYADTRPINSEDPYAANNRRITIELLNNKPAAAYKISIPKNKLN